ncbi:MAG: hypothetical protein H6819_05600 [Phycisphaerales bacterium]|nr:hypothetical protein [Phycisphaerales bacterium]MCB9854745.1 hypothetical protein [Phycisphaerales bacterium]
MDSHSQVTDRRPAGSTFFDFTLLFRAFGIAIWQPARLALALAGVIASVLLGMGLDAAWPASASPVALHVNDHWVTESGLYRQLADSRAVRSTIGEMIVADNRVHASGVFKELLLQVRLTEDRCIAAVFGLNPGALFAAARDAFMAIAWLVSMHAVFAILYGLGLVVIWGFVGIGICRGVALAVARNDEPSLREYRQVCKSQWMQAATIPVLPLMVVLASAIALWIFGLVGAIPFVGSLIVGVLFPIAILGGVIMAMAVILGALALPLAPFGIAAAGSDAGDAIVDSAGFVVKRPVKSLFYYAVAFVVGVIAFAALKWIVALSLWCGGKALGTTMDLGAASFEAKTADAAAPGMLEAMWIPPSPAGESPFYGTPTDLTLTGTSWLGRHLIRLWLMFTWAVLAAFAVSYFYASAGIAWFLLRRDVDHTDITEVIAEIADKESGAGSAVS